MGPGGGDVAYEDRISRANKFSTSIRLGLRKLIEIKSVCRLKSFLSGEITFTTRRSRGEKKKTNGDCVDHREAFNNSYQRWKQKHINCLVYLDQRPSNERLHKAGQIKGDINN